MIQQLPQRGYDPLFQPAVGSECFHRLHHLLFPQVINHRIGVGPSGINSNLIGFHMRPSCFLKGSRERKKVRRVELEIVKVLKRKRVS